MKTKTEDLLVKKNYKLETSNFKKTKLQILLLVKDYNLLRLNVSQHYFDVKIHIICHKYPDIPSAPS